MNMEQALLRFEQYLRRRFPQSSTRKHYLSDLYLFARISHPKAPDTVTPKAIDTFIEQQLAAGLCPTTINRRLATLRSFFEFLAGENPQHDWPNPVIPRRHYLRTGSTLPRDVGDRDVTRLFAIIDDVRDRAIFSLMLVAGLRVSEVVALRRDSYEAPRGEQLAKLRLCGKGNKERIVWLTPSLWQTLQAWLQVRPPTDSKVLFLNHHGRPLSVSGIQYRLKQYSQLAQVRLSCHRLRHTFARRLVEHGLPVESLAKLLGHTHLQTTQRYIAGADPTVRADFQAAMTTLETSFALDQKLSHCDLLPQPTARSRTPSPTQLQKLRRRLASWPTWLGEALDAFLCWHWPTWRAQTAYEYGQNLLSISSRFGQWVTAHRSVQDWESLRRADLEAWLQARCQEGISASSLSTHLTQVRMILKFIEDRGVALDPGLFRVKPPQAGEPLPRYLPETEYHRLETTVLEATREDSYASCLDRAWFLLLAETGLRLSELLDLRLEDLDLAAGCATVRGGKAGRDRVVYLTPALSQALQRYLKWRPPSQEEDHFFIWKGRPLCGRSLRRWLVDYGRQAGVQVSPHRLRHTFATRLVNRGMPIGSLRKLLGHQHLSTTQLYAQIYDETLYRQFHAAMSSVGKTEQVKMEQIEKTQTGGRVDFLPASDPLDNSV